MSGKPDLNFLSQGVLKVLDSWIANLTWVSIYQSTFGILVLSKRRFALANSFGTDILIQSPDARRFAQFYVEQLGFEISSQAPMIELKGARINLYMHEGPALGPVLEVL